MNNKCKECNKNKGNGWHGDDRFCSVDCAQTDCDREYLHDEMSSENPNFDGLFGIENVEQLI